MEPVEVIATTAGVRLRLRVKPGARRDRLLGPHGGALKIEVSAPPERGRANAAVVKLLARHFGVPKRAVTITAGVTSQGKTVELEGVSVQQVQERLRELG